MINFRFHLISLIAVFLALAVGVVMGYAVLGQPTVDTLQGRVDTVEARANEIRAESDALRAEQSRLEATLRDIDDFAATSRLTGASVLPVAVRGVEEAKVIETALLARRAEALVPGIVWLEEKWGLASDEDTAELAAIVGSTSTSRTAVRDAAARALAARLTAGPAPAGRTDLLLALEAADFIALDDVGDIQFDGAGYDGRGSRVLVAGSNEAAVRGERSVVPLARALAATGRPVVVADDWRDVEQGPRRGEELSGIRDDRNLASQVATVDNLDTVDGPLTTVLVLGERGQGTIGHYGFGRGADRAVPAWWLA